MIMRKVKTIYVPMGADILHSGHLNIIKTAKKMKIKILLKILGKLKIEYTK